MKACFFVFCLFFSSLQATPWGKDADLVYKKPSPALCKSHPSFLSILGKQAIRFHQEVISPADGPRSHFIPSSSQYTLEAIQQYGFFGGCMRGCDRLMRENEDLWVYQTIKDPQGKLTKWDPVK